MKYKTSTHTAFPSTLKHEAAARVKGQYGKKRRVWVKRVRGIVNKTCVRRAKKPFWHGRTAWQSSEILAELDQKAKKEATAV